MGRQVDPALGITGLREAARSCDACELAGPATGTVFSVGSPAARIALVGEQPGDVEDRTGVPFVGPAGKLLDRALEEIGLDRRSVYVTNAVKHFRFRQESPGARRIHVTPELTHLEACRPWLRAELSIVDPEVTVLLGATAARALLGPRLRVTRDRGRPIPRVTDPNEPARVQLAWFVITTHPSAVLRADDTDAAYSALVADLRIAVALLI